MEEISGIDDDELIKARNYCLNKLHTFNTPLKYKNKIIIINKQYLP